MTKDEWALFFVCLCGGYIVGYNTRPDTLTPHDSVQVVNMLQADGFRIYDQEGYEVDRIEFTDESYSHWSK